MRSFAAVLAVLALCGCSPQGAIAAVFHRHGEAVVDEAMQVAECESRFDEKAVNGPNLGLFQMNVRYHSGRPGMDRWDEALFNSLAAESLWLDSGRSWRAWACDPR